MFGTKEQQREILEAIGRQNDAIEQFGKEFGKGMETLDKQADELLEWSEKIKKGIKDFKNIFKLKNI